MKTIALIDADFANAPLGTRSRLTEHIMGQPVLHRTIARVLQSKRLASACVVAPAAQASAARDAIAGMAAKIETHDAGPAPWRAYLASSRKWAMDAWRGGIGGTTLFDESLHPWAAQAIARRENADAVAIVPAAAAIIDPALLDAMIAHYEKVHGEVRLTFTQSAPGLSACIYSPALLADLAQAGQFIGRVMAYRPSDPQREMNIQPCFFPVENAVAHASGRCLADTGTGCELISRLIRECGEGVNAASASRWLVEHRLDVPALPDEVEVELTTQDPLPNCTLRPRGDSVPQRGPMGEAIFLRLVEELGRRDDARLVLGGFGDPLMHPAWPKLLQAARGAGIFGIAIRTPAIHLDASAIEQIIAAKVDVVNVLLDAHTPQTYAAVHRADFFDHVRANIEALLQASRRPGSAGVPLVVCEMIKTRQTMPEMEAFYDHWLNKGCGAVIAGPSRYGGRWPDQAAMDMSPPTRVPCSRLFRRCTILADGTVPLCDQDGAGAQPVGNLARETLSEIWRNAKLGEARAAHLSHAWNTLSLCSNCSEWHRP